MEYQEWQNEDQRDQIKGEIRTYEQQHANRTADANKYAKLLAAKDAGQFDNWDRRILIQREKEWKEQLSAAQADIAMMVLMITDARERYEAFLKKPIALKPNKPGDQV